MDLQDTLEIAEEIQVPTSETMGVTEEPATELSVKTLSPKEAEASADDSESAKPVHETSVPDDAAAVPDCKEAIPVEQLDEKLPLKEEKIPESDLINAELANTVTDGPPDQKSEDSVENLNLQLLKHEDTLSTECTIDTKESPEAANQVESNVKDEIETTDATVADTIDVIEETIVIPMEVDSSEGVPSENELVNDDQIMQTTETIEYNVIEYTNEPSEAPAVIETENEPKATPTPEKSSETNSMEVLDKVAMENGECTTEDSALNSPTSEKPTEETAPQTIGAKRSVIQDIFDDWGDENPSEEECTSAKTHDTVEQELKSLLDDDKQQKAMNEAKSKKLPKVVSTPAKEATKEETVPKVTNSPQKSTKSSAKVSTMLELRSPVKKTPEGKAIKTKVVDSRKKIIIVRNIRSKSAKSTPATPPIKGGKEEKSGELEKKSSADEELLAILEGDVDPDWSKPPTLVEESKDSGANVEHSTPPRLDPLVERELALKQLLELPATPKTKNMKTRTLLKSSRARTKENIKTTREATKRLTSLNNSMEKQSKKDSPDKAPISIDLTSTEESTLEVKAEETRSGRKRKPTEKAREHEITAKRQKSIKPKSPVKKNEGSDNAMSPTTESNSLKDTEEVQTNSEPEKIVEEMQEDIKNDVDSNTSNVSPEKKSTKEVPIKKVAQNAKRKTTRPKVGLKKTPPKVTPKKSPKATTTKSSKKSDSASASEPKPKKKIINEIDRLLQDEGVVNLLYDVEQPGKKRLVPVTQSHAKVMDIQKVQRELRIRTKLVRNAVLRLRTSSTAPSSVTPRSKRSVSHAEQPPTPPTPVAVEKKPQEAAKSPRTSVASPSEFMFPAKIRNAADASIIVRRHSSSSFSSASGSPRVSFDGGERQEAVKHDDNHALRSNKRRVSQDERKKPEIKKLKKDLEKINDMSTILPKSKPPPAIKVPKKVKIPREVVPVPEATFSSDDESLSTRSNGANAKSLKKKSPKSKVSFANKDGEEETPQPDEEPTEQDDALSACLAEAVTALATENRAKNAANRKKKAEAEVNRAKDKIQFSNKEINVQRHGYLVQLILTPSTTSKIRNGITLQMMQEFREALTILKKDDECRVVLLTSTGSSFCEGLELASLLDADKDTRRANAQELANGVKDFIKSLATFNKPIVAGVQGSAVGLGVTMLPLFDLVIASDKASFSTPYGKLGQIAEGAAVFTLSHVLGSAVTSELLLGGRTLTANEALRAGLVTRVLWPDRFQVELLPSLRAMSEQSAQSMEATKALLRHSLRKKLDAALESETYLLVQHWSSAECQEAIKIYMDEKVQ